MMPTATKKAQTERLITHLNALYIDALRAYLHSYWGIALAPEQKITLRRYGDYGTSEFSKCKVMLDYPCGEVVMSRWMSRNTLQVLKAPIGWHATHRRPGGFTEHYIDTTSPLAAILYASTGAS